MEDCDQLTASINTEYFKKLKELDEKYKNEVKQRKDDYETEKRDLIMSEKNSGSTSNFYLNEENSKKLSYLSRSFISETFQQDKEYKSELFVLNECFRSKFESLINKCNLSHLYEKEKREIEINYNNELIQNEQEHNQELKEVQKRYQEYQRYLADNYPSKDVQDPDFYLGKTYESRIFEADRYNEFVNFIFNNYYDSRKFYLEKMRESKMYGLVRKYSQDNYSCSIM